LLAASPAAGNEPLNIAVGGIQPAAAAADLFRVKERPVRPEGIFQAMEVIRTVGSFASLSDFPIPDIKDSRPAALRDNRLKNSEYLAQGLGEGFQALRWEGTYTARSGRENAVAELAGMLREQHRLDPGRPINVVCHSHGCGIALEAFAAVESEGVRVERFVSLGTRLTGLPGDNRRDKPANVRDWVNIHSRGDAAFSKALDGTGILNVESLGGGGHAAYYEDPALRRAVADLAGSAVPPAELLRGRYPELLALPRPEPAPS